MSADFVGCPRELKRPSSVTSQLLSYFVALVSDGDAIIALVLFQTVGNIYSQLLGSRARGIAEEFGHALKKQRKNLLS